MAAIPATPVRELDHRRNNGIDVALLWDAQTDRVSLALTDEHSGESLTFAVDPAEALTAFHHPFAYAHHPGPVMSARLDPQSSGTRR
jgi:hypothetical protein